MSEDKKTEFSLEIPEQLPPGKDSLDISKKGLEAWLKGLPRANSGETARLLYGALNGLSRTLIHTQDRLRVLEAMRLSIYQVTLSIEKHYIRQSTLQNETAKKISHLALDFQKNLILGYLQVAFELRQKKGLFFNNNKNLILALERVMYHLNSLLLISYQTYSPPPPHVWMRLNQIQHYAHEQGIENKSIEDPLSPTETLSVNHAYLQAVLLSMANPYRFSAGEAAQAFRALFQWAPFCKLVYDEGISAGKNWRMGIIQRSKDTAPGQMFQAENSKAHAITLILDQLAASLLKMPEGELPEGLNKEQVEKLLAAWKPQPKRGAKRTQTTTKTLMAEGMRTAHYVVEHQRHVDLELGGPDLHILQAEIDSHLSGGSLQTVLILDQSSSGCRIVCSQPPSVANGHLVTIQQIADSQQPMDWHAYLVRWIRQDNDGKIEVGLERIAGLPRSILLRVQIQPGQFSDYMPCLQMIQPDAAADPVLIAPSFLNTKAKEILLTAGGDEHPISIPRVIEQTNSCALINFRFTNQTSQTVDPETRRTAYRQQKESEYDSVWDRL